MKRPENTENSYPDDEKQESDDTPVKSDETEYVERGLKPEDMEKK